MLSCLDQGQLGGAIIFQFDYLTPLDPKLEFVVSRFVEINPPTFKNATIIVISSTIPYSDCHLSTDSLTRQADAPSASLEG